jgi:hypothetical protein
MSEQDETQQNDDDAQQTDAPEAEGRADDAETGRSKADADRIAKTNRENASLRRRLKELEDRDKTEIQRATESAQEAAARADKAEHELLRVRVAADKGLTLAQSRRLVGDSEADLRADADALLDDLKPSSGAAVTRKPQEDLRGGSEPDEPNVELDPITLAEQIRAAR